MMIIIIIPQNLKFYIYMCVYVFFYVLLFNFHFFSLKKNFNLYTKKCKYQDHHHHHRSQNMKKRNTIREPSVHLYILMFEKKQSN